jgi:sporulation protein YlmC with PRC-barrel domain
MIRRLMIATAVSGLALSTAWAQAPSPSPSPSTSPSASNGTESKAGSLQMVPEQKPDQWLASKFMGTDVIGADGKKIGDVSDILFDKSGKIDALVVGMGGVLGIGAKDIAFTMASFQVIPGASGKSDRLRLSTTQDQLKQAADFKPYNPPATTGSGSSSSSSGMSRQPAGGVR